MYGSLAFKIGSIYTAAARQHAAAYFCPKNRAGAVVNHAY
jgi:hypothetical protein